MWKLIALALCMGTTALHASFSFFGKPVILDRDYVGRKFVSIKNVNEYEAFKNTYGFKKGDSELGFYLNKPFYFRLEYVAREIAVEVLKRGPSRDSIELFGELCNDGLELDNLEYNYCFYNEHSNAPSGSPDRYVIYKRHSIRGLLEQAENRLFKCIISKNPAEKKEAEEFLSTQPASVAKGKKEEKDETPVIPGEKPGFFSRPETKLVLWVASLAGFSYMLFKDHSSSDHDKGSSKKGK